MRTKSFSSGHDAQTIVIGCDNHATLAVILERLENCTNYNLISVVRVSDLIRIINSVHPALIILNYRNNQLVQNNLCGFINKPKMPLLYLTHKHEIRSLKWDLKSSVFTMPLEHLHIQNHLALRVNSVLILMDQHNEDSRERSFARESISKNFLNHKKNLSRYVLELDQKVRTLRKVKDRIKGIYSDVNDPTRQKLMSIVNSIKTSTTDSKHWDDFKIYFESTTPKFLDTLSSIHPDLTAKDIKYCCYLKMSMSNNDIGHILGINNESVRTHKYRLKKKLDIPRDETLQNYIKSIA